MSADKINEISDRLDMIQDQIMFFALATAALDASGSSGIPGIAVVGELIAGQVGEVRAELESIE